MMFIMILLFNIKKTLKKTHKYIQTQRKKHNKTKNSKKKNQYTTKNNPPPQKKEKQKYKKKREKGSFYNRIVKICTCLLQTLKGS